MVIRITEHKYLNPLLSSLIAARMDVCGLEIMTSDARITAFGGVRWAVEENVGTARVTEDFSIRGCLVADATEGWRWR